MRNSLKIGKNHICRYIIESILNTHAVRHLEVETDGENLQIPPVVPIASCEISPFARVHRIHLDARCYSNNELCT